MDDELPPEEIIEEPESESPSLPRTAAGVIALAAVVAAATVAIYTGVAQTAAGLVVFPGIPLVLLWFVWRVFLRRLWRIRRIRNAQEKRELLEAARRSNSNTRRE